MTLMRPRGVLPTSGHTFCRTVQIGPLGMNRSIARNGSWSPLRMSWRPRLCCAQPQRYLCPTTRSQNWSQGNAQRAYLFLSAPSALHGARAGLSFAPAVWANFGSRATHLAIRLFLLRDARLWFG